MMDAFLLLGEIRAVFMPFFEEGEIKNTQAQLKDVEILLKLDPGNTELLAQKHKLLGQADEYPFETWPKIHEKLIPCFKNFGPDSKRYQILFAEIEKRFSQEDRYERGELSLEFLQGLSSQRQILFQKWKPAEKKEDEGTVTYEFPKRRSELYGCLLAIAYVAEQEASEGEGMTNAMRMMSVFAARPYESWGRLHGKLLPYLEKLEKKRIITRG